MTLPNCHYKTLGLKHLPELMALERATFLVPWSASLMRESLQTAHHKSLGMYLNTHDQPIGYATYSLVLDEAEILSICIAPDYHRKGYGKQLLDRVIANIIQAKAHILFLEVRASNTSAIELYRQFGFEQIDLRRNYYRIPDSIEHEDALVFRLNLTTHKDQT